jgi:hypothetical protein
MANTLSHSNALHKTYNPVDVAKVIAADEARMIGRQKLAAQAKSNVTGYQALMAWKKVTSRGFECIRGGRS